MYCGLILVHIRLFNKHRYEKITHISLAITCDMAIVIKFASYKLQAAFRITGHEPRGEGRVYGGGLNKIEPSELARIFAAPFVGLWPEIGADVQPQRKLFG